MTPAWVGGPGGAGELCNNRTLASPSSQGPKPKAQDIENRTANESLRAITDDEVEAFRRDGAVCLRGVMPEAWVRTLRAGTEQALQAPGRYANVQSAADDPGFFFTEYYLARRLDAFHRFVMESPGGEIASRLLGADEVRFFFDGLFVKEPGTRKPSQWHQDQPYYPVDGEQVMVLWTPLDPVTVQTSLEVIRGSHRWGKWYVPVLFRSDTLLELADERYEVMPDIDPERDRHEILSWDMQPGDCIAFHGLALHGARGNPLSNRRRALATTWLGDDTVFAPRAGELEAHFSGLSYPVGSRLTDQREFPLAWPKPTSSL